MKKKIFNSIVSIIACSSLVLGIYNISLKKKIAYVDNVYLFDNCKLKADLYSKIEASRKVRESILDSLKSLVEEINQSMTANSNIDLTSQLRKGEESYYIKQQKYSEEMQVIIDDANKKIWDHINLKTIEFGKLNKFDYLFGANGQGSIMYAKEVENISEKLLEFIDNKYEDIND